MKKKNWVTDIIWKFCESSSIGNLIEIYKDKSNETRTII